MINIRSTVIENFLTAVEADTATPPALTAELRALLTAGKLPDSEQIVTLVMSHTTAPSTDSQDSAGGAA